MSPSPRHRPAFRRDRPTRYPNGLAGNPWHAVATSLGRKEPGGTRYRLSEHQPYRSRPGCDKGLSSGSMRGEENRERLRKPSGVRPILDSSVTGLSFLQEVLVTARSVLPDMRTAHRWRPTPDRPGRKTPPNGSIVSYATESQKSIFLPVLVGRGGREREKEGRDLVGRVPGSRQRLSRCETTGILSEMPDFVCILLVPEFVFFLAVLA